MRTIAVARATGYSAQLVRDLELLGVIPAAARSANGYRRYTEVHVRALHAYRALAHAVGSVEARRTLRTALPLPVAEAAAVVCGLHVRLDAERRRALAARAALESIRREAETDAPPAAADALTISELAEALGVRPSALRYWEQVGLVAPERVVTRAGTARRYPVAAVREARITAALRAGGYRVPDVQRTLAAVRSLGAVADPLAALDARLDALGRRAVALLRAGAALADLVDRAPVEPPPAPPGRRSRRASLRACRDWETSPRCSNGGTRRARPTPGTPSGWRSATRPTRCAACCWPSTPSAPWSTRRCWSTPTCW